MNLLAKRGGFRHHVRMVTPAFSDCINKLGVDEKDVIPFGRNKDQRTFGTRPDQHRKRHQRRPDATPDKRKATRRQQLLDRRQ